MKYEQKTVRQYWGMMSHDAKNKVWDKFGVAGALLVFLASIIAYVLIRQTQSRTDIWWGDVVWVAIIFLVLCVIAIGFVCLREPVFVYNGQQSRLEEFEEDRIKRLQKPKLEIYYDNADELCRHIQKPDGKTGKRTCYMRLKIKNNEGSRAEGCVGRLESITDVNGVPYKDWTNSPLAWEGMDAGEPYNLSPSGDYKYLDIGLIVQDEPKIQLRTIRKPRGTELDRPIGQYFLHIILDANGYDPASQWFGVNWEDGKYDAFNMKKIESPVLADRA